MEPMFYRCFTDLGLRKLCLVIAISNLLFEIFFVWLLVVGDFNELREPGVAWWVNIWYILSPTTFMMAFVVMCGLEVPLTCVAMVLLISGVLLTYLSLVRVACYLQLMVLIPEVALFCLMLLLHQAASDMFGLFAIAVFLWLRVACYFVTTSYARQVKRAIAFDNTNYVIRSFVMGHLRNRAEATRVAWASSSVPVDEEGAANAATPVPPPDRP